MCVCRAIAREGHLKDTARSGPIRAPMPPHPWTSLRARADHTFRTSPVDATGGLSWETPQQKKNEPRKGSGTGNSSRKQF
eukprot:3791839-Pyramimonas_sp.AAC.1